MDRPHRCQNPLNEFSLYIHVVCPCFLKECASQKLLPRPGNAWLHKQLRTIVSFAIGFPFKSMIFGFIFFRNVWIHSYSTHLNMTQTSIRRPSPLITGHSCRLDARHSGLNDAELNACRVCVAQLSVEAVDLEASPVDGTRFFQGKTDGKHGDKDPQF